MFATFVFMKTREFKVSYVLALLAFALLVVACKKDNDPDPQPTVGEGNISFQFHHYCEGEPLEYDIRKYTNEAGNEYMVNEIQYFISEVILHKGSESVSINEPEWIHYIDTDISSTHSWQVEQKIPAGGYDSITFTFGLSEEKNQSLIFSDPPESNMFWPEHLGGGYHYMKLNGKWLDTTDFEHPFNFHLGIGQEFDPVTGDITGFIQNYFMATLPASSFDLSAGQEISISLVMHVDRWFKNPHTYDHNVWGGHIMQKQEAMRIACDNGHDVFEILGFGL